MPYRIDVRNVGGGALDRLIDLGALDVDQSAPGAVAAVMPDSVSPFQVARALGIDEVVPSPAVGRDDGSVWILAPRAIQVGRLRLLPSGAQPEPGAVRLIDGPAFGTGLHSTTAMCLEALADIVESDPPSAMLDVGTGSGVLALAALVQGVSRALGIDLSGDAVHAARDNARLNGLGHRLHVVRGGPEALAGMWPLVTANVLAGPLIELAPTLVRRVGHRGRLVLSGIARAVAADVTHAYVHLGMRHLDERERDGWVAVVLQATW